MSEINLQKKKAGRCTLVDIARETGKSAQVVSKVLNGSTGTSAFSHETRDVIMRAAKKMGYRRNSQAHSIRSGRTNTIGLLIDMTIERSFLPVEFVQGLIEGANKLEQSLKIDHYSDDFLIDDMFVPKMIREIMVDGLIVAYHTNTEVVKQMNKLFRNAKIPAIWTNNKLDADCVYIDDYKAGYDLTSKMLADGYTDMPYIDIVYHQSTGHYSREDRMNGYRQAMLDNHQEPKIHLLNSALSLSADAAKILYEWYEKNQDIKSVVCYGSEYSLLVHTVLPLFSRKPWDLMPGVFGGNQLDSLPHYHISASHRKMAIKSVAMLSEKIDNPEKAIPPYCLEYEKILTPADFSQEFIELVK